MVKIDCQISTYTGSKKGGRLSFVLDQNQAQVFEAVLANFRDKPLSIDIMVDAAERIEQLNRITDEQRKKIYALCKDISNYYGNGEEDAKTQMKEHYCLITERPPFSLADCSKEEAGKFLEYLLDFCMSNGIALSQKPGDILTDLQLAQKMCIEKKICCICGKPGEIHHYDAIGLSHRRGNEEDETTLRKMCLCRQHHTEAHNMGKEDFCNLYHIEPVLL